MEVQQFDHSQDTDYIKEWLQMRNLEAKDQVEELPYLGFMVSDERLGPICAGFLRRTEGHFALLDSMISNPSISSGIRDKALDLLTETLIKQAKELKLKQLIAYTVDKNTLMRSDRHGFKQLSYTVIALDLSSGKDN